MVNVGQRKLERLAKALGTTAAYLRSGTSPLSPSDHETLLHFRNWIDDKLPKINARDEPNAILIASEVTAPPRSHAADMIADRAVDPLDVPNAFARRNVQHVLRASGDSMIEAGIVNNDTLYATAAPNTPPLGRVIACSLGGSTYVKRLVSEHDRFFLLSANRQYLPIKVDQESDNFEIIGIVIGRTGAVE